MMPGSKRCVHSCVIIVTPTFRRFLEVGNVLLAALEVCSKLASLLEHQLVARVGSGHKVFVGYVQLLPGLSDGARRAKMSRTRHK